MGNDFRKPVCLVPDQVLVFALFQMRSGERFIWTNKGDSMPDEQLRHLFEHINGMGENGFATAQGGRLMYYSEADKRIHVWGAWHRGWVQTDAVRRHLESAYPDHELVMDTPPPNIAA